MRPLWRFSRRFSDYPARAESIMMDGLALPLSHSTKRRRRSRIKPCGGLLTFRGIRVILALLLTLFAFKILLPGVPSTYKDVRRYERQLPQHNKSLALGRGTRYLRIPNRVSGRGFNNVLQEALLLAHLAHKVQRSYVFEDYVWSNLPLPFTIDNYALRPSKVPLNAFVSGPIAGDSIHIPKAVSAQFWESVCPPEKTYIISSADQPSDAEGDVLLDWWIQKISNVKSTCVEINSNTKIMFDYVFFGGDRVLSLWEGLSKSPVLADYAWSRLVHSALSQNAAILQPRHFIEATEDITSSAQIPGLVAVHLRRGDFSHHCLYLEKFSAGYMGFCLFPEFQDKFDPLKYKGHNERKAYYMRHCLPTVEQVAEKLWAVRTENPGLRRVYVMTNGQGRWLRDLRSTLLSDGWEDVKSSVNMQLDMAQKHVSMAVDMAIAEKAEVFVGNGFSSLTSNVMMLRMAKGLDPTFNRLL